MKVVVVALVLDLHELAQHAIAVDRGADRHVNQHVVVRLGRAETVDAAHAGDDDHVVALEQRPRRGVAHPVDLLVHQGVLGDVGVGRRDVRLGLVVVVIAHEVLHRVLREELAKLRVELRRQRLVGRQDQCRDTRLGDHVRDGEGLARPGHTEQALVVDACLEPPEEGVDGSWLVATGFELRDELKIGHGTSEVPGGIGNTESRLRAWLDASVEEE